jgi:transposase
MGCFKFRLDYFVSQNHLLHQINSALHFEELRRYLSVYYNTMGRSSIDPELMIRMVGLGYCYDIRVGCTRRFI